MSRRHLILRVSATVMTVAAVGASGASAMPTRDAHPRAAVHAKTAQNSGTRNPRRVDAAAHADTVRRIGARVAAPACG
jgi:hypothetical protein